MTVNTVAELDDRTAILTVQYLAEDLQPDEPTPARTEQDARLVIAALLAQTQKVDIDPESLLRTEPEAVAAARRALIAASIDSETREPTAELLAEPPQDEQMSLDVLLASGSVFALLISWLQTRVKFRIHRKDGKTEVEFSVLKQAADTQVLRTLADTFRSILGISTPTELPPADDKQNLTG